jgi:prepilin-type N-terminal cleavage/methylation domain-containing protein
VTTLNAHEHDWDARYDYPMPHRRQKNHLQKIFRRLASACNNSHGVTLLEVMVALGIAAIVLVTVYRLQTQAITMETAVQFHTVAPLLAEKVIAGIEQQVPDIPGTDQGHFGEEFERYSWEFTTRDAGDFSTPTGQPLLKQIDVRIYRHDTNDQFNLRTYRLAVPAP